MIKVHFKCPVRIDETTYAAGMREVPAAHVNHWYFKALLKDKHVKIQDATDEEVEEFLNETPEDDSGMPDDGNGGDDEENAITTDSDVIDETLGSVKDEAAEISVEETKAETEPKHIEKKNNTQQSHKNKKGR